MSPDILSKISQNSLLRSLNDQKKDKLLRVLSTFKKSEVLYPGMIIRHTGITMNRAYQFLDGLEEMKILQKAYEIHCPNCQRYTGDIYDSLNDIPNEFFCDSCNHEFSFPHGVLIVYRVVCE